MSSCEVVKLRRWLLRYGAPFMLCSTALHHLASAIVCHGIEPSFSLGAFSPHEALDSRCYWSSRLLDSHQPPTAPISFNHLLLQSLLQRLQTSSYNHEGMLPYTNLPIPVSPCSRSTSSKVINSGNFLILAAALWFLSRNEPTIVGRSFDFRCINTRPLRESHPFALIPMRPARMAAAARFGLTSETAR